jgi:hypothetical protein
MLYFVSCVAFLFVSIMTLSVFSEGETSKANSATLYTWNQRRTKLKRNKMEQLMKTIWSARIPNIEPLASGSPHSKGEKQDVVFTAGIGPTMMRRDARMFVGTLRNTGFKGDIVIAVSADAPKAFSEELKKNGCVIYEIATVCDGEVDGQQVCKFKDDESDSKFSINMIRYYLYRWWALKYPVDTTIMISDFRDVFFQSNPFTYKRSEWAFPKADLVVFQEAHPQKTVGRCPFNGGWVGGCYGPDALRHIAANPVTCSGVSIGTRTAIAAYSYLMTQQLNPVIRYGKGTDKTNKGCTSLGMDQGFHNWLVYSGILDRVMTVLPFQQGEGPVNTLGAFFPGRMALIKTNLTDWGVLKGIGDQKIITNWNGDPSPAIHQADRFLDTVDLKGDYPKHLKAFQGLFQ